MRRKEGFGDKKEEQAPKSKAHWWTLGVGALAAAAAFTWDAAERAQDTAQNGVPNRPGHSDSSDTSGNRENNQGARHGSHNESNAPDAESEVQGALQVVKMDGLDDDEQVIGMVVIDRSVLPGGVDMPEVHGTEAHLMENVEHLISQNEANHPENFVAVTVVHTRAEDGSVTVSFPEVVHAGGQDITLRDLDVPHGQNGAWLVVIPRHHEAHVGPLNVDADPNKPHEIHSFDTGSGLHDQRDRHDAGVEHHDETRHDASHDLAGG